MHHKAQTFIKKKKSNPTTECRTQTKRTDPDSEMSRLVQRSPPSTPNPDFQIGPFQGKSLIFFCPPNPNYPHVQRHLSLKTTPTCRTQLQLSNRKREREREREIEIEIDRYRERKFTDEHREISHYYYYKLHRKYQTKGFSKP